MAIVLTLNIQNGLSGGGTTTVITKPTSTVDGDFLLAAVQYEIARTMTPPSGWTQLATYTFGTDYCVRIWYKRASSEGSSYTWTTDTGCYTDGIIWRLTGVVTSGDPLDATSATNGGDGTALTSSSITTGTNGAAVIQLGATNNDYTSLGSTTLTERFDDGITIFATGDIQASAGASGAKTGTLGTSRLWGIIMLALKPDEGGPVTVEPTAVYAVCNKINPQIGADPYLLASVFRRFPSQELEDIEFEDDQQGDALYWVEDKPGLATDDIIEDFFEYSGIPEPLVVLPAAINAVCSKVDPTIPFVTLFITPAASSAIASRNNPVIRLYITPAARNAIGSRNNPSILVTPPLTITPAAINAISASVSPTINIPVLVAPVAIYAIAGKVNPVIQLYITPDAIYAVTNKFDPNVPINTIAGSAVTRGVDPYGLVTPPVVVSFEMWRDSIPTVVDPFVLINPLYTDLIPTGTICHVVNPYVYVLGGTEYVLPNAASVIAISIDPSFVLNALQIIELISRISIQLELASIIKTELNLDSNIYNLLELDSKIPERMTVEPPPAQALFDVGEFDEVKFQ